MGVRRKGEGAPLVEYEVTERTEDYVCLILRGELTGDRPVQHFKRDLERHYVDDGVRTIKVKVDEVTLLTVEGCALLVQLWEESERRGKRLVLEHPTGQVRAKLAVTGLLRTLSTE